MRLNFKQKITQGGHFNIIFYIHTKNFEKYQSKTSVGPIYQLPKYESNDSAKQQLFYFGNSCSK